MSAAQKLRLWWRSITCAGSVCHLAADSSAAAHFSAARGAEIGAPEGRELTVFHCRKWHNDCEVCPRFKAYRKGLALGEHRSGNLHMAGAVIAVEADVRHGDREGAEVHGCEQDAGCSVVSDSMAGREPNPYPVVVDGSPRVDHTQHCAKQRNGEGQRLDHSVVHRHILPQRGMALPSLTAWLAGITLAVLIGCAHYLDDIPDHSAEWDQAVYLQDAINAAIDQQKFDRAAQALCGPQAAWAQLQDGSVQCRTKYGKPTITVQVSP